MGQVCISEARLRTHLATEALSVAVTVPFLFWASGRVQSEGLRFLLRALAVGELVIDGYLLLGAWPKRGDR